MKNPRTLEAMNQCINKEQLQQVADCFFIYTEEQFDEVLKWWVGNHDAPQI